MTLRLDAVTRYSPVFLSILRIVTALVFVEHGSAKLLGFPVVPMFASGNLSVVMEISGVLELVGGTLLAFGLLTRPVAFLLSGEMAIGYFMMHLPHSVFPIQNGGDAAILYCFIFLYVFFAGAGVWSVDGLMAAKK